MATTKKDWSVKRPDLKNKQKEVKELSEADKARQRAAAQQAIKLFTGLQPGADNFGKIVAGFQSIAESVKPRGNKKDPTPSVMGGSVGKGTKNTATPTKKTEIDALTEKETKANNIVKKALADGSPNGIRNALADVTNLYEDEINEGLAEVNKAAEDPVVKEQFAKLGLDSTEITNVTKQIDGGKLANIIREGPTNKIVADQKKVTTNQMKALGNPFGSFSSKIDFSALGIKSGDPISPDSKTIAQMKEKTGLDISGLAIPNPFGSMGIDKGNLMGTLASSTKGLPAMTDIGTAVPAATGGDQLAAAASGIKIPDIIDVHGRTNLSETVDKGTITAVDEPTTPVEEVGFSNTRSQNSLLFTTVNSMNEFEIEMRASGRRPNFNFMVGWTFSGSNVRLTAKEYHEIVKEEIKAGYEKKGVDFNKIPEYLQGAMCHYFIRKDGTLERVMPLETRSNVNWLAPKTNNLEDEIKIRDFLAPINDALLSSTVLFFDAGSTATAGNITRKTVSPKSITDEQWATFDKVCATVIKISPAKKFLSMDAVWEKVFPPRMSFQRGPGFDVDKYCNKFNGRAGGSLWD